MGYISPALEEATKAITCLLVPSNLYPPPASTLHTVTDPADLKYSLTVWGTYVSLLKPPNFL